MIRILIGGDVCPMGRIERSFIQGDAGAIFHDLLDEIAGADLSVVNLECPLVARQTPIDKAGPVLGASSECVKGFAAAKWQVLNLANNHSYDHGALGLADTISAVRGEGLGVVGAGATIREARTPFIREVLGQRIVIYAMAEREFSAADKTRGGSNPLDMIGFVEALRVHKKQGPFIVLLHGGKEFYPYPSPEMVRRCRFMIDQGADAVVCCHSHCPLPWEIYSGRPIVYGLGNLIFEPFREMPNAWFEGYLASLTVGENGIRFEPIPYLQSKGEAGARKMLSEARRAFVAEMEKRGAQIAEPGFIEARWAEYCREARGSYLSMLFGYNRIMRKMRGFLLKVLHGKEERLRALNLVQCETHREVLEEILKRERGEPLS
jgi:poly-gamma-glutamate synthesis protein (capsule biosynthesis protein)